MEFQFIKLDYVSVRKYERFIETCSDKKHVAGVVIDLACVLQHMTANSFFICCLHNVLLETAVKT